MKHISKSEEYFRELRAVTVRLPFYIVDQIAEVLINAYEEGSTTFLFGNGGSAALAAHLACDLGKGTAFCNGGKRFRAMALTDNLATLTAWANDADYADVFSEQLQNFVKPRDVAFAISGSGRSRNVLAALKVARDAGATTVGISGYQGGEMKDLCDICMVVPSESMQIIEDLHLATAHSIYRIVHARISLHSRTTSCCG